MRDLILMVAVCGTAGCAAPRAYMGIDLGTPVATEQARDVQIAARNARSGDKAALLRLGTMFEAGAGMPTDPDRACRLYALAARTTGGTIFVYMPPVRKGGRGSVMPVTTPVSPGLPEAATRRAVLLARDPGCGEHNHAR